MVLHTAGVDADDAVGCVVCRFVCEHAPAHVSKRSRYESSLQGTDCSDCADGYLAPACRAINVRVSRGAEYPGFSDGLLDAAGTVLITDAPKGLQYMGSHPLLVMRLDGSPVGVVDIGGKPLSALILGRFIAFTVQVRETRAGERPHRGCFLRPPPHHGAQSRAAPAPRHSSQPGVRKGRILASERRRLRLPAGSRPATEDTVWGDHRLPSVHCNPTRGAAGGCLGFGSIPTGQHEEEVLKWVVFEPPPIPPLGPPNAHPGV